MIKVRTVFVLGAGAHCPYGLPDGGTLTRQICELLPGQQKSQNKFEKLFHDIYYGQISNQEELLVDFRHKLERSGHSTIDSFLMANANTAGFAEAGKLAVAFALTPMEFKFSFTRQSKTRPDQDWMSYLFTSMVSGTDGTVSDFLSKNDVSFITFNYDRTLEHFLWLRLANTFGLKGGVALKTLRAIPLIHMYGSLGEFTPSIVTQKPDTSSLFKEAASGIHLMYDDRAGQNSIEEAKKLVSDAPNVCFLGFGFDPDNVQRLDLKNTCAGKRVVAATRYGVEPGEWSRISEILDPVVVGFEPQQDWDCLQLLRKARVF